MPGRSSQSTPLEYIGIAVALLAIVGYALFGWRFEATAGSTPFVVGAAVATVAVAWTLYQLLSAG